MGQDRKAARVREFYCAVCAPSAPKLLFIDFADDRGAD
jgi:hypothetical protein